MEGTRVDLILNVGSDQYSVTSPLAFYTGGTGPTLPGNDPSFYHPTSSAAPLSDLAPVDLGNLEPLWMAENGSCLLKAGDYKYVLWRPDASPQKIDSTKSTFLAHRLTRQGVVVGTVREPVTIDEAGNRVQHSWGAKWDFNTDSPVALTTNGIGYTWPKNAAPLPYYGKVYSATKLDEFGNPLFITNALSYPTLHDVWDMNATGKSAGSLSMQATFAPLQINFNAGGTMSWLKATERGLDAGAGGDAATYAVYFAQLTTAAEFTSPDNWRWLGPLNWEIPTSVATLINDAGMIAGMSAVNDPALNHLRPTHAFRAPLTGECSPFSTFVTDLGVLLGGAHSFARSMNQSGELVGYSDFNAAATGGLNANSLNAHPVYWSTNGTSITNLGTFGPVPEAPFGYGDAYNINDLQQIVGTSVRTDTNFNRTFQCGVLWQWNNNTNGTPGWEINDLNSYVHRDWRVIKAVEINNSGLILARVERFAAANGVAPGQTPVGGRASALLLPIDIREVISDQIAGDEHNKLPTAYGGPRSRNPMLMATRSGRSAYLAVRVAIKEDLKPVPYVGVRLIGTTAILGSAKAKPAPEKTLLQFDAIDGREMYEVVAGGDANGNGKLDDAEATIVFEKTPKIGADKKPMTANLEWLDKFVIVTEKQFLESKAALLHYNLWGTDYAGDLISAFSHGSSTVPEATTTPGIVLNSSNGSLEHPVGARWDANGDDKTFKLTFVDGTEASNDFEGSNGFKKIMDEVIKDNVAKLLAAAGPTPTTSSPIVFSKPVDFGETDAEPIIPIIGKQAGVNELGVSFGHAIVDGTLEIKATKTAPNTLHVISVTYSGSIDDLYDFDFFSGDKPKEAATVQAGHATLAKRPEPNSGKVFFLRLEYKGSVNLNSDFTK